MTAAESHQVNNFSADAFYRHTPRPGQPLNLILENARVSLKRRDILFNAHLLMCIPFQEIPLALANNQREIPPPDRGVPELGRMQGDLHHVDVAYQGIVDHHPQPLAVSNFHPYAAAPLFY